MKWEEVNDLLHPRAMIKPQGLDKLHVKYEWGEQHTWDEEWITNLD